LQSLHSNLFEAGWRSAVISEELRKDVARYVAGKINPEEMLARAKIRYGIG
jgi:hypothetical protein